MWPTGQHFDAIRHTILLLTYNATASAREADQHSRLPCESAIGAVIFGEVESAIGAVRFGGFTPGSTYWGSDRYFAGEDAQVRARLNPLY
jgi:hypothetical protein